LGVLPGDWEEATRIRWYLTLIMMLREAASFRRAKAVPQTSSAGARSCGERHGPEQQAGQRGV